MLVRAGLVTPEQVAAAAAAQLEDGVRLGDHLIAMGAISHETLEDFLHRVPKEPNTLEATGIDPGELLSLLLKIIYVERLHTVAEFSLTIKLAPHLVTELVQMAVDRHLLQSTGSADSKYGANRYALSEEGKRWAIDAMQQCRYSGPAPVTLDDFKHQVARQKLTNETITHERMCEALSDLIVDETLIEQCGPAMATSKAILLYGPPGNGKTSVAVRLAAAFDEAVYVPYTLSIDGQIIRVFDSSVHHPLEKTAYDEESEKDNDTPESFVRRSEHDPRWVACRRPVIITGGELTLEMLDLRYDINSNIYESPLHVKALGGCLVIDDFGRQLISPTHLLNRWIVPLENRIDFMRLQTGKTFQIPFEELLIFSTNLDPEDLMDPAFLRRLPYKIEIAPPDIEHFARILALECDKHGLTLTDAIFQQIIRRITKDKGMGLSAYHPKFIVEQVVATCRFLNQPLHFNPRYVDHAIDNLRVKQASELRDELSQSQ